MTTPLQSQLRARADAHAREWADGRAPESGVDEVLGSVRRRRRGRGLVASAGAVAGVVVLASATYLVLGGLPDDSTREIVPLAPTDMAEPSAAGSALSALGDLPEGAVVVTVREPVEEAGFYMGLERVLIVDPATGSAEEIPGKAVLAELGTAVEGWPSVSLVAIDPAQSLAVFELDSPTAYVVPTVAVHDWSTGTTVVEDPCESTLQRINLSSSCPSTEGSSQGHFPTGVVIELSGYDYCIAPRGPSSEVVAATCVKNEYEGYLVTLFPATGEVASELPIGLGVRGAPWVVDGEVFVDMNTTEGDPVLSDSTGGPVVVGGGWVGGVAVVGDRLLVRTSSDNYGPKSTYGYVLGLWAPSTGEFEPLAGGELEPRAQVGAVEVVS